MTEPTKTDDATTVSLQYPTEFAGETVSTLTIKARPTVADLKRIDSFPGEVAKTCRLISSLCSVPMALVEALHPVLCQNSADWKHKRNRCIETARLALSRT